MQRRDFLEFMGRGALLSSLAGSTTLLQACITTVGGKPFQIPALAPSTEDKLRVADGLKAEVLIRWQDPISPQESFGFNNDFIALLPGPGTNSALMWVNHEYVNPIFVSGYNPKKNVGVKKNRAQVDREQKNVGGSLFRINKNSAGRWQVDTNDNANFRIDATTPIKLIAERPIAGTYDAIGTTGNCCGGQTPWGTILTCEENFDEFFGNVEFSKKGRSWHRKIVPSKHPMAWDTHTQYPPEHYGWVVEINPRTRAAKKLTALGRFAHEGALVLKAADGRCVVYMGDDTQDQHFYKFISDEVGSLEKGQLYVANLETGTWEHLSIRNPKLQDHFVDQTDLLIRTREAAKLVGATPLDRPEACAQDPIGKGIYLNCTMNKKANRPYGSILKFVEQNNDVLSMKFTSDVFLNGGPTTGFACPDNLCFDSKGNMWMTSDIADYDVNTENYKAFGNNSLFYIPLAGENAGHAFRIMSAPIEAEITGPCFSPDGKTLFVSIQHPGANSQDEKRPTSHWPDGGESVPRPSVVAISGPLLERLVNG